MCLNNKIYKCNSILIISLHFLNDLMNHWQLLNNLFVNNIILNLEIIHLSLIKYENTIIKNDIYAQEQRLYSCIYKLLNNVY